MISIAAGICGGFFVSAIVLFGSVNGRLSDLPGASDIDGFSGDGIGGGGGVSGLGVIALGTV